MRVIVAVLALTPLLAGCGDKCGVSNSFSSVLNNIAPGPASKLDIVTQKCSTCRDSTLAVNWTGPPSSGTGTIDVAVSPACFVHTVTITQRVLTDSDGKGNIKYSFNAQNCGDQIDYEVTATNNSSLTLSFFQLSVDCPEFVPPK